MDTLLDALPLPQNRTELLLRSFYRTKLQNVTSRNDTMCKHCLTHWASGQFALKMQPSKHKRKTKRHHQIDRLQKAHKSMEKNGEKLLLQRKLKRLQEQNNHVGIHKCEICLKSTRVPFWKPKPNKQDINENVTAANDDKHKELTNKPKKNKGKKKKKNTAGLIIPPKKIQGLQPKQLSMTKLSDMFQKTAETQMSKLNQFLK